MYSGSDMRRYRSASRIWYNTTCNYNKLYANNKLIISKKSIDECYIDLTEYIKYRIKNNIHKKLVKHTKPDVHYNHHKQRHHNAIQVYESAEQNIDKQLRESTGNLKVAIYVSQSTDPITQSGVNSVKRGLNDKKPTYQPPDNIQSMTKEHLHQYQLSVHPIDYVRAHKLQQGLCELVDYNYNEHDNSSVNNDNHNNKSTDINLATDIDSNNDGNNGYIGSEYNQWIGNIIKHNNNNSNTTITQQHDTNNSNNNNNDNYNNSNNNNNGDETVLIDFSSEDINNPSINYMLCIGSQIVFEIRSYLFDECGLTTSSGISYNPMLAKLASSIYKPNQQSIVRPTVAQQFLHNIELAKVPGFGV